MTTSPLHPTPLVDIKVVAVIVTFNRLAMLEQTLMHTLAEPFDKVIVVNNASTDGTHAWLETQRHPLLDVIHLPVNVGGAGGFHHGFDYVVRHIDADWLVCFDDDAYPQVGSIDVFRALAADLPADVAGVAAAVFLPDGRISEMNRPSHHPFTNFNSILKTIIKRRQGFHVKDNDYLRDQPIPIVFSSFVGCFLRVQAIREQLGLPRKELFIYGDDILYTQMISKHGLRHWFAPTVRFTHDCSTLQHQQDVYVPMWKVYYTYRNRLEIFRQVAGTWAFGPIALAKLFSWILKVRHYDHPGRYMRLLALAWTDGMLRRFDRSHAEVLRLASTV